jgi:hypothetical protein
VFGNASTPSAAYGWLQNGGYISGTQSQLVEVGCSPLVIFGGNMPPGGNGVEAAAKCALVDWVAAGALNN